MHPSTLFKPHNSTWSYPDSKYTLYLCMSHDNERQTLLSFIVIKQTSDEEKFIALTSKTFTFEKKKKTKHLQ